MITSHRLPDKTHLTICLTLILTMTPVIQPNPSHSPVEGTPVIKLVGVKRLSKNLGLGLGSSVRFKLRLKIRVGAKIGVRIGVRVVVRMCGGGDPSNATNAG